MKSLVHNTKIGEVNIFESVRELQYSCPEKITDSDNRCWGKHRKLKKELDKAGYKTRYRVCSFYWNKQRIPKEITKKAPEDLDYHLFLEIKRNSEWIVLDCTNDSGLPNYNKWDGKSNCRIAVNYEKILSPKESIEIEKQEAKDYNKNVRDNEEFYKGLNKFFGGLRKLN